MDVVSAAAPEPAAASAASELQQLLLSTEDIGNFLDELAARTITVSSGDVFCGVTLRRERGALTGASSDVRTARVDEVQYGNRRGPCLHALDTGEVVVVDDLVDDERWDERRSADDTFDVLRTISHNRNVKLHHLAAETITSVSGRSPTGAAPFS